MKGYIMSDPIDFGEITILDVNQNNLYDKKVDKVVDEDGNKLTPKEKSRQLKRVLNDLNLSSWKGLKLFEASSYFNNLKMAEYSDQDGKVQETEYLLFETKKLAQKYGLPFSDSWAAKTHKSSLTNKIREGFQWADYLVNDVDEYLDIARVKNHLDEAAINVDKFNIIYSPKIKFDKRKADDILKKAFREGIPTAWLYAEKLANEGSFNQTKEMLGEIKKHTAEANKQFKLGLSFDPKLELIILKLAYQKGISLEFKRASLYADLGSPKLVKETLRDIKIFIKDANSLFTPAIKYNQADADKILAKALRYGVKMKFQRAKDSALASDKKATEKWLKLAMKFVKEHNQSFPKNQALVFDSKRAKALCDCAEGLISCKNL